MSPDERALVERGGFKTYLVLNPETESGVVVELVVSCIYK